LAVARARVCARAAAKARWATSTATPLRPAGTRPGRLRAILRSRSGEKNQVVGQPGANLVAVEDLQGQRDCSIGRSAVARCSCLAGRPVNQTMGPRTRSVIGGQCARFCRPRTSVMRAAHRRRDLRSPSRSVPLSWVREFSIGRAGTSGFLRSAR